MAVVNISLPDKMKSYIEQRLVEGQYSSTSEYIRTLVREDQKRQASSHFETLILEGVNSGDPVRVTPGLIEREHAAFLERSKMSIIDAK